MAQRGKPSIAHEYNGHGTCIYCGMYKVNVDRLNHVCKPRRENEVDEREAKKLNLSVEDYRFGERH